MAKGDDEKVQSGIDYNTAQQRGNQDLQNKRVQKSNDIFYGTGEEQQAAMPPPITYPNRPTPQINYPSNPNNGDPSGGGGGNKNQPRSFQGGGQQQQSGGGSGPEPQYNSKDPASVDAYIAWMQQQPGVNPSVINDPGYWRAKMLADPDSGGGLGPDASYVKGKMMTPEGAPAGSSGYSSYAGQSGMPGPMGPRYGGNGTFGVGGVGGQAIGQQQNIMDRASDFAETGGFSQADLSNIRNRALSPQRAIYAQAASNLMRQRALQGGYSPGFNVAAGRMAREQGQGMSDAATGAESNIAQMVQQGKLGGIGAMNNIYGSTPGLANMFQQGALEQGNQQLGQQASGNQMTQTQLDKANAGRGTIRKNIETGIKGASAVAGMF